MAQEEMEVDLSPVYNSVRLDIPGAYSGHIDSTSHVPASYLAPHLSAQLSPHVYPFLPEDTVENQNIDDCHFGGSCPGTSAAHRCATFDCGSTADRREMYPEGAAAHFRKKEWPATKGCQVQ